MTYFKYPSFNSESASSTFKGNVSNVSLLPPVGVDGDLYFVEDEKLFYVYDSGWVRTPVDASELTRGLINTVAQNIAGDKTFKDDVIIDGDLTVNGALVQLNVNQVNVEDNNIRMNKGGTDGTAADGGIEVEGTGAATVGSMKLKNPGNGTTSYWELQTSAGTYGIDQSVKRTDTPTFADITVTEANSQHGDNIADTMDNYSQQQAATGEITGFENQSITLSPASQVSGATFTLTVGEVGTWYVWVEGKRFTKVGTEQITVASANPAKAWAIYYDTNGVLQAETAPFSTWRRCSVAYVAFVQGQATEWLVFRETHGFMPWQVHQHLHESISTYKASGGAVSGITLNPAVPVNNDNAYAVATAVLVDEDIRFNTAAKTDNSTYRYGFINTSGILQISAPQATIAPVGTTYIQYNPVSGGLGSLVELGNNEWVNLYILASIVEDASFQYIGIIGQNKFTTLALAQAETVQSINLDGLGAEAVFIQKLTLRTSNTYTTTGKFRIEDSVVITGTRNSQVAVSGVSPSNHNLLSNRSDANSHPASAISNTPSGNIAATDVQAALNELQSDIDTRALDSAVVHMAGNETITGVKTYTNNVKLPGQLPNTNATYNFYLSNGTTVAGSYDTNGVWSLAPSTNGTANTVNGIWRINNRSGSTNAECQFFKNDVYKWSIGNDIANDEFFIYNNSTFGSAMRIPLSTNIPNFPNGIKAGSGSTANQTVIENNTTTNPTLKVLNSNTGTSADGVQVISCVKSSSTNTTSQKFITFEISAGATGSGQITANGANQAVISSYSDRRLKENIVPLQGELNKILALNPCEFDYIANKDAKTSAGHNTGFIAQEIQEVYPDAVSVDDTGFLSVGGWDKTTARLVKAIQEQNEFIKQLEQRILMLENKL